MYATVIRFFPFIHLPVGLHRVVFALSVATPCCVDSIQHSDYYLIDYNSSLSQCTSVIFFTYHRV